MSKLLADLRSSWSFSSGRAIDDQKKEQGSKLLKLLNVSEQCGELAAIPTIAEKIMELSLKIRSEPRRVIFSDGAAAQATEGWTAWTGLRENFTLTAAHGTL